MFRLWSSTTTQIKMEALAMKSLSVASECLFQTAEAIWHLRFSGRLRRKLERSQIRMSHLLSMFLQIKTSKEVLSQVTKYYQSSLLTSLTQRCRDTSHRGSSLSTMQICQWQLQRKKLSSPFLNKLGAWVRMKMQECSSNNLMTLQELFAWSWESFPTIARKSMW